MQKMLYYLLAVILASAASAELSVSEDSCENFQPFGQNSIPDEALYVFNTHCQVANGGDQIILTISTNFDITFAGLMAAVTLDDGTIVGRFDSSLLDDTLFKAVCEDGAIVSVDDSPKSTAMFVWRVPSGFESTDSFNCKVAYAQNSDAYWEPVIIPAGSTSEELIATTVIPTTADTPATTDASTTAGSVVVVIQQFNAGEEVKETTTTAQEAETTTNAQEVEETTTNAQEVEETTTTVQEVEETTTTVKEVEETTTTGQELEETTTIVQELEETTTTAQEVEETSTTVGKTPETKVDDVVVSPSSIKPVEKQEDRNADLVAKDTPMTVGNNETFYWCEEMGNRYGIVPKTNCQYFFQKILDVEFVNNVFTIMCPPETIFNTNLCVCLMAKDFTCPDGETDSHVKTDDSAANEEVKDDSHVVVISQEKKADVITEVTAGEGSGEDEVDHQDGSRGEVIKDQDSAVVTIEQQQSEGTISDIGSGEGSGEDEVDGQNVSRPIEGSGEEIPEGSGSF